MINIRLFNLEARAGETISGEVIWTVPDKLPKQAIAFVGWRTEGRGDVDWAKVQEIPFYFNKSAAGSTVKIPFQFQIPFVGPVSYNGSLFRIIWEVKVEVDDIWNQKDQQAVMFQVIPRQPV